MNPSTGYCTPASTGRPRSKADFSRNQTRRVSEQEPACIRAPSPGPGCSSGPAGVRTRTWSLSALTFASIGPAPLVSRACLSLGQQVIPVPVPNCKDRCLLFPTQLNSETEIVLPGSSLTKTQRILTLSTLYFPKHSYMGSHQWFSLVVHAQISQHFLKPFLTYYARNAGKEITKQNLVEKNDLQISSCVKCIIQPR